MSQRINYQRELKELHDSMIRMGSNVEESIHMAINSLIELDSNMAQSVIEKDDEIDDMEHQINQECIMLIARQQPVARDLREITSNMKLITDLERIADHAEDIAEHVIFMIKNSNGFVVPHDVVLLANLTQNMIHAALDAYVSTDLEKAKQVVLMDNKIDKLYAKLKKYLVKQMMLDPQSVEELVEMLFICKHLERIGDHAENVAEWIVYYIEGKYATSSEIKKELKLQAKQENPEE